MLLLAPLREELVFRAVIFSVYYIRSAALTVPLMPVSRLCHISLTSLSACRWRA